MCVCERERECVCARVLQSQLMDVREGAVLRGSGAAGGLPLAPSPALRSLAVAAAADNEGKKKIGKKHPGKAILAGE